MKIYRKLKAFTLIEMLVVFAIIGILAGMSTPGLIKAQVKSRYENDVKEVYDMLLEARTNAIAGMTCDGQPSAYWSLFIEKKHDTEEAQARITCFSINNKGIGYLTKKLSTADITAILFDDGVDADENIKMEEDEVSGWVSTEIRFLTGKLGVRLFQIPQENFVDGFEETDKISKKKVKIVFYNRRIDSRALCFSRIAGYPTLNKNSDKCLEE